MRFSELYCSNNRCQDYGKRELGNLIFFGTYPSKNGQRQRFKCQSCGKTFSERAGSIFYGIHTEEKKVFQALAALAKKRSTKRVAKTLQIKLDTLHRWLHRAASKPKLVGEILLKESKLTPKQIDGLWKFIRKRLESSSDSPKPVSLSKSPQKK